jgi:hypothetical protein
MGFGRGEAGGVRRAGGGGRRRWVFFCGLGWWYGLEKGAWGGGFFCGRGGI